MKFKKFFKFTKGFYLSGIDIYTLVDCAYEQDRKAKFKLGSYSELCALISRLNEMKEFWRKHNDEDD